MLTLEKMTKKTDEKDLLLKLFSDFLQRKFVFHAFSPQNFVIFLNLKRLIGRSSHIFQLVLQSYDLSLLFVNQFLKSGSPFFLSQSIFL